jgi:hypothetical protein
MSALVTVYRVRRGVWRWRYEEDPPVDGSGPGLRLESSIAFPSADEAAHAASEAYPDVPLAGPWRRARRHPGRVLLVIVAVACAVAWLRLTLTRRAVRAAASR